MVSTFPASDALAISLHDVSKHYGALRAVDGGYWNAVAETANSTIWLLCPLAAGVAAWDIGHIVDLLKTGVSPRGSALGPMAVEPELRTPAQQTADAKP